MEDQELRTTHNQWEKGQSLVEMALGSIVLVILLSGLLDLGRMYFVYVAMEDSVGEAAVYLSINPSCWLPEDGDHCADPNNGYFRARNANTEVINFDPSLYTISPANADDRNTVGEPMNVTMRYPVQLLTPIVSQIAQATNLTLTVNASQLIIVEN